MLKKLLLNFKKIFFSFKPLKKKKVLDKKSQADDIYPLF